MVIKLPRQIQLKYKSTDSYFTSKNQYIASYTGYARVNDDFQNNITVVRY